MEKMTNKTLDKRMILKVNDVFAGYGKKEVLRGVSLEVKEGEIVALLGPNGAGKSTLLKFISGMLNQTQGNVYLNGKEITATPTHQRVKEGILHFLQGGQVFPNLTIKENLEMGAIGFNPKKQREAMEKVMEIFPELKKDLKRRAGLLSGGQRQMLALGTILIKEPKMLLLDEPSAGLAPNLVIEFMKKVKEINQVFKMTVLLVEQNVRQALEVSQRAYVLVNGKVQAEYDNPRQLLTSGDLEKLFFQNGFLGPNKAEKEVNTKVEPLLNKK
jgi:ABC-type branched-subunit amino acid transport system ATPase component